LNQPVIDGNIVTCVNDLCNHFYNSDAIAIALENRQNLHSFKNRNLQTTSPPVSLLQLENTIWCKTYGGSASDGGNSICQTADGGFVICGYTFSFGNGNSDVYLIKTNSDGDTIWSQTYGSTGPDLAFSVQETNDNGFIICGTTGSSAAIGARPVLSDGNMEGKF